MKQNDDVCEKCLKTPPYNYMLGDAYCSKHNFRYSVGNKKKPCPICAEEDKLCVKCGEKILK